MNAVAGATLVKAWENQSAPLDIGVLLRGETAPMMAWNTDRSVRNPAFYSAIILVGAGLYGASMGWWRDPMQGFYTAVKFPAIILLTTLGNAHLNAMLAPLLGLNISFRQSLLSILASFAIASAILGSFSPVAAFAVWNAPPLEAARDAAGIYSLMMLAHVGIIAFAGTAATLRLRQLLRELGGSARVADRVLLAWLAGNLFLGSQLSWILRPFIGAPGLPVQFLRDDPLRGNFYETVFRSFWRFLNME